MSLLLPQLSGLHFLPKLLLELLLSKLPQLFGICVSSRANGAAVQEREFKGEDAAGNNVAMALNESVYLEPAPLFSLSGRGISGVWTSDRPWFGCRTLGSSGVLRVSVVDERLQKRAFSTAGSPCERLVWAGSIGGVGSMWREGESATVSSFSVPAGSLSTNLFGDFVD